MVTEGDFDTDLPNQVYHYQSAAKAARHLSEYFEAEGDDTFSIILARIAAIAQAKWQDINDTSRYGARVTFVDGEGEAHTAIVLEPEVSSMPGERAWDPYQEKMVNVQEEYPLGTVQLVYPADGQFSITDKDDPDYFFFDRVSNLEAATSVTPARGPDDTYVYYPGWDYALGDR